MNEELQRVFVYGTPRHGCSGHDWLAGAQFPGEDETCKRPALYAGRNPCPLMIENEPCCPVRGELDAVIPSGMPRLDDLEECPQPPYCKAIGLRTDSGEAGRAWACFYPQPEGVILPDGFYMEA